MAGTKRAESGIRRNRMSKCTQCFNELTSGDSYYEIGCCNKCYKEIMHKMKNVRPVVININKEKDQRIAILEKALELYDEQTRKSGKTSYFSNNFIQQAEKELLGDEGLMEDIDNIYEEKIETLISSFNDVKINNKTLTNLVKSLRKILMDYMKGYTDKLLIELKNKLLGDKE